MVQTNSYDTWPYPDMEVVLSSYGYRLFMVPGVMLTWTWDGSGLILIILPYPDGDIKAELSAWPHCDIDLDCYG